MTKLSEYPSIKLNDGTTIPVVAWGSGSGTSRVKDSALSLAAVEQGFVHLDTAQSYGTEEAVGETVTKIGHSNLYLTTKLSNESTPIKDVQKHIEERIKFLGGQPNLILVHNPFVAEPGQVVALWQELERLKDAGVITGSIGVSNFRPQDLTGVLAVAKYKPVVNQIEYHPLVLSHLGPVLEIMEKNDIVVESYGPLTPFLRHKNAELTATLKEVAARVAKDAGKDDIDEADILLLWVLAHRAVAVTTTSNTERMKRFAALPKLPALTSAEVEKIDSVGKKYYFRHYSEHMTVDFPEPDLPQ